MKEEKRSKVVLQTVAQLPNHPLVRKAGLFFCQGFKDIRMARSEIFTDKSDDIHFSGSPRPSNGLAMTRRIRSCDDDRSSSLRAKRGNLGIFIQDKSLTSYFSKLLPVSKDFMGSLPKDPGQGKKLCGVQKFSVMKGEKEEKYSQNVHPLVVPASRCSDRQGACYKAPSCDSATEITPTIRRLD
jgi:hypothetical protein